MRMEIRLLGKTLAHLGKGFPGTTKMSVEAGNFLPSGKSFP